MKTCLVIEDDLLMRENLVEMVKLLDFHVVEVKNGEDALKQLMKQKFDLVICDVKIPLKSGVELYKTAQEKNLIKDVPFIFLTSQDENELVSQLMGYPKVSYLQKPFRFLNFIDVIRPYL